MAIPGLCADLAWRGGWKANLVYTLPQRRRPDAPDDLRKHVVAPVRDANGRWSSFAGTQIDGRVRHQLSKAIRLELDAVLLVKGQFLLDAPNAPAGRWTRYVR